MLPAHADMITEMLLPLILFAIGPFPRLRSWADVWQFLVIMAVCLAVLGFVFRKAWLKYTPKGFAFFCLGIVGMGCMGLTAAFATGPSSAERITIDGYCRDFHEVVVKGARSQDSYYVFLLEPSAGPVLRLQTPLTPSYYSGIEDGARVQVTYLDEKQFGYEQVPRVIALTVLSGVHAGWHGSVNANWLGAWLLFPTGAVIAILGAIGMFRNRRLKRATDGVDTSADPNSGFTDLRIQR